MEGGGCFFIRGINTGGVCFVRRGNNKGVGVFWESGPVRDLVRDQMFRTSARSATEKIYKIFIKNVISPVLIVSFN